MFRSLMGWALAVCLLATGGANAELRTFTGGGDGFSWSDPANWDTGLPVLTSIGDGADTVLVADGHNVLVDTDVEYVAGITIDGDATITVGDGLKLGTNGLSIVNGGLILGNTLGGAASITWGKANRGSISVEADGYIAGSGSIRNLSGGGGVQLRSTRSADFDMTDIALTVAYTGNLTVCSTDLGRESAAGWDASNFAIKSVSFSDRRYSHTLNAAFEGSVLYCGTLSFGGYTGEASSLNLQGHYAFMLDAVNFVSGNTVTAPGELTVYALHDDADPFSSLWDDTADPGRAYVGVGVSPNDPPFALAGDDQSRMDADNNGVESFDLDGSASYDDDGTIISYVWTDGATQLATGAMVTVDLSVGVHTITLTVTDDDGATATDEVVITVEDPADMYPPTADAGADQVVEDLDDSGSETVTLDGSGSFDVGLGTIVSYSWKENGLQVATGVNPSFPFVVGTHEIILTVTDNHGQTDSDTVYVTVTEPWIGDPVTPTTFENRKSGISVALTGVNGGDYAVEQLYHDPSLGDQLIFMKSDVLISLAHNERNSIMNRDVGLPGIIGVGGLDGIIGTGDEGDIHWKIDRDMQSHGYTTVGTSIPDYAPLYAGPIDLASLTYDGALPVLGTTGDNGGPWGSAPMSTSARYAYGQTDQFGNEWHTLTYWDNDAPVYEAANVSPHRQAASDGHWLYICVDPVTPIVQFYAPAGEQYYTTPLKTYHVPKTWDQTTYLTSGVLISLLNVTNDLPIFYRVDDGAWQQVRRADIPATDLMAPGQTIDLQARIGADGPVFSRTLVMDPAAPAPEETHGYLLWADETEKQQCITKLNNTQPFKKSYQTLKEDYYQSYPATYTDARGGWRSGAGMASSSLANAFAATVDGPAAQPNLAALAKTRLLRMARLEPVGFEDGVSQATPSKDYLNELSQTLQLFADAGVAYDLLASCYRDSDDPAGMTPIEELFIRDGLAEIAKSIIQFRDNWSYTSGAGDTHWAHGYELAVGIIAASMPSYATPYFGVSGADFTTVNDLSDEYGEYWNPFPYQGATWWACATDSEIDTPGYPDNKAPQRCEFLTSDDGWWTGPNDLVGDGDRYFEGPMGSRLVDVKYGGMANAECRVELVEMSGYESPFPGRLQVLEFIRRHRGDDRRQTSVGNYIRRRQMAGYITLSYDSATGIYTPNEPRYHSSICAFNDWFEGAALASSVAGMTQYLDDVSRYYGYLPGAAPDYIGDGAYKSLFEAYPLALCWDPNDLSAPIRDANHSPIVKPLFKYVVAPGTTIVKHIIAMDLDDDPLTISASDLPGGAVFDASARTITWTPGSGDLGVHILRVSASDGNLVTTRPFPILVMTDPGSGPIPAGPGNVTATLNGDDVTLAWDAPSGVNVGAYVIYKDGALIGAVDGATTTWTELNLPGGSHTRYHVAAYDSAGHESSAATATPAIVSLARAEVPKLGGDANGDGQVDIQDFVILKQNYGQAGGWSQGDFNDDGAVDIQDFVILKQNYGQSVTNVGVETDQPAPDDGNDGADDGASPMPAPAPAPADDAVVDTSRTTTDTVGDRAVSGVTRTSAAGRTGGAVGRSSTGTVERNTAVGR